MEATSAESVVNNNVAYGQSSSSIKDAHTFFARRRGHFRHLEFPELARWILTTLNLAVEPPLKHSHSKRVKVLGWKESTDMNETRLIDGTILI